MQRRYGGCSIQPCGARLQRVARLCCRREPLSLVGDGRDESESVSGVPGVRGGHDKGPSGGVKKEMNEKKKRCVCGGASAFMRMGI